MTISDAARLDGQDGLATLHHVASPASEARPDPLVAAVTAHPAVPEDAPAIERPRSLWRFLLDALHAMSS